MGASEAHQTLVLQGKRWLAKQGFAVVATELSATGSREQPDVVGFRSTCSAIIEVKVNRADFLADARKPERSGDGLGVGNYRFYLCPKGLIRPEELPARWGLLYSDGGRIQGVKLPPGNVWPNPQTTSHADWQQFQHESNLAKERAMLFSIARRLAGAQKRAEQ